MGNSLFDQMKKAGLVDDKKAKQVKREKHQQLKQGKSTAADDGGKALAQQAQAEKVARDRELNQQRQTEAGQRALLAQVQQIVAGCRITVSEGDIAFNFSDDGKVRRIYVDKALQSQLTRGQVAIIRCEERYELVPAAAARKISERHAPAIVLWNTDAGPSADADDDPYADYQVPDDLMW